MKRTIVALGLAGFVFVGGLNVGAASVKADYHKPAAIRIECFDATGQAYVEFVRTEGDVYNDLRGHTTPECAAQLERWGVAYVTAQEVR